MIVENISWSISMKECCWPGRVRTRKLLITSRTRTRATEAGIMSKQLWTNMQTKHIFHPSKTGLKSQQFLHREFQSGSSLAVPFFLHWLFHMWCLFHHGLFLVSSSLWPWKGCVLWLCSFLGIHTLNLVMLIKLCSFLGICTLNLVMLNKLRCHSHF